MADYFAYFIAGFIYCAVGYIFIGVVLQATDAIRRWFGRNSDGEAQ